VDSVFSDNESPLYALSPRPPFIYATEAGENAGQVLLFFKIKPSQIHCTILSLAACLIQPVMKFAVLTISRAFGAGDDDFSMLELTFGKNSGLSELFYCHGMVGVMVAIYL
jgi:hypothetical protein